MSELRDNAVAEVCRLQMSISRYEDVRTETRLELRRLRQRLFTQQELILAIDRGGNAKVMPLRSRLLGTVSFPVNYPEAIDRIAEVLTDRRVLDRRRVPSHLSKGISSDLDKIFDKVFKK